MDNDGDFYSQSEDNQDLSPDTEILHVSETLSEISTDDMGFLNLLKKFLGFFGPSCSPGKLKSFGRDRPRSSIELAIRKTTKRAFLCLS